MFRDGLKNPIVEGDTVAMALGNGQLVNGRVIQTTALVAAPNQPQYIVISFNLIVQSQPDGIVSGVFKLALPETSKLTE